MENDGANLNEFLMQHCFLRLLVKRNRYWFIEFIFFKKLSSYILTKYLFQNRKRYIISRVNIVV